MFLRGSGSFKRVINSPLGVVYFLLHTQQNADRNAAVMILYGKTFSVAVPLRTPSGSWYLQQCCYSPVAPESERAQ